MFSSGTNMKPSSRQCFLIIFLFVATLAVLMHFRWLWSTSFVQFSQRIPPPLPGQGKTANNIVTIKHPKVLTYKPTTAPKKLSTPSSKKTQKPSATPLMGANLPEAAKSLDAIRSLYFREVTRVHFNCRNLKRIGRHGDGGWDVCLDNGFAIRSPCLAYSFGVGNIWEFDEQLARDYKCTVRAFDPTMGLQEHVHKPGDVHFYPIGLGGVEKGTKGKFPTQNLSSFLRRFKEMDKVIDILKIDIEYSEWEALESIINDNLLGKVKQLVMELHTNEVNNVATTANVYLQYLNVLKKLEENGFRKFKTSKNNFGVGPFKGALRLTASSSQFLLSLSCCYEVYYINTKYRR